MASEGDCELADKQIVAFGGLRPAGDRTHPLIMYILSLSNSDRPKVCFIPTATGDAATSIVAFYDRFPSSHSERSHLSLFNRTVYNIEDYLLCQDIIIVGGGNTANMLATWRIHGVDTVLGKAWNSGVILCGGSAGSLCWFECGTTDSFNINQLEPLYDGLGFLPGSHCPHYDGEEHRRPLYYRLISEGFAPGYAVGEDAAIHFIGTDVHQVVSSRETAGAYYVQKIGHEVIETSLETTILR
jgi:dipeptidase E